MLVSISRMVLRLCWLLALILGILFWIGTLNPDQGHLKDVHMTLGIIVAICLIILGIVMITTKGGSAGLGFGAIVLAILVIALGVSQTSLLTDDSVHWIVQVVHLLFGLAAIGLGEMIGSRYRRIQA